MEYTNKHKKILASGSHSFVGERYSHLGIHVADRIGEKRREIILNLIKRKDRERH